MIPFNVCLFVSYTIFEIVSEEFLNHLHRRRSAEEHNYTHEGVIVCCRYLCVFCDNIRDALACISLQNTSVIHVRFPKVHAYKIGHDEPDN